MNVYAFIGIEEKNNLEFVESLLELENLNFHPDFKYNVLETIEKNVKKRFYHIIQFEAEVAVKSDFSKNKDEFISVDSKKKEWMDYFYEEYPVLEKYLKIEYNKVRNNIFFAINSLSKDYNLLNLDKELLLTQIDIGKGDFHNGLSTCKLIFNNQDSIYFKPRSLSIDNFILEFLYRLEKKFDKTVFYKVQNIERDGYGWSFPVPIMECEDKRQVIDFYYGMGIITAVSYFLNIEDLIYDNLISTNGKIALIDLECSFCIERPINKKLQFVLDSYAGKKYRNSVLNTGIIPRHTLGNLYKEGISDASLSFFPKRFMNRIKSNISDSKYSIEKSEDTQNSDEFHIPVLKNKAQTIKMYHKDYFKGFEDGFLYLLNNKKLLLTLISNAENLSIETRVIYRPTKVYAILIDEFFNPKYLKEDAKFIQLVNSLRNGKYAGIKQEIVNSEISQIKTFNIPAFKKIVGKNNLLDFSGKSLQSKYHLKSDTTLIKEKIVEANFDDFEIQKRIIIDSLKVFEDIEEKSWNKNINWKNDDTIGVYETALSSISNHIKNNLFIENEEISCINMFSNVNNGWEVGVCGPGLSNGLDGIALFFGVYGHFFNKEEFKLISKQILEQNFKNFLKYLSNDKYFEVVGHIMTSPFQFPTSLIYVNEVMKEITGNYILNQNDLLASYKTFFYKHFDRDEHFDFIIGSCGASFLFYQLYKKTGNNVYFEFFKFCTEHLFNNSKNQGEYTFWETDKFKRLGGFSHGASSLAISMLLAYDILKEDKYLDCFNRVIKYDRSLYDSNEKAYLDIRYFPTKKISNAWAHGHGGIALSRLIIESYCQEDNKILKEIKICRNHLNKCMVNGIDNYTVNGGFAGNIEILKALNNKLNIDNKYLDDLFNGYIGKIVSQESSLISEKNHIHLFINQGVAGLGYSILRHLFTDKVPSLLVLGVDTSFGCKYLYNEIKN